MDAIELLNTPAPYVEPACAPDVLDDLLTTSGVLDVPQLQELVLAIVDRPEIWEPIVIADPARRRYELIFEDERIDVWALFWMPGQGTGFHDHDVSGVGLATARGVVRERRMLIAGGSTVLEMTPGVVSGGPGGYIHSVAHATGDPAITIHAYSPPLMRVGQYKVDDDGILRREPEHGRKELVDATIARATGFKPGEI